MTEEQKDQYIEVLEARLHALSVALWPYVRPRPLDARRDYSPPMGEGIGNAVWYFHHYRNATKEQVVMQLMQAEANLYENDLILRPSELLESP